jgi:hypothetical protein
MITLYSFFLSCGLIGHTITLVSSQVVTLDVSIDRFGNTEPLYARVGQDNLQELCQKFVETHGIYNGAGCENDVHCVTKHLVDALTKQALAALNQNNAVSHKAEHDNRYTQALAQDLAPTLIAGDPNPFSECGWHANGDPFSLETPLSQATERSLARTQPMYEHLGRFAINATVVLDSLYAAASKREDGISVYDDALSVLGETRNSCGGSGPSLAIGIISGPGNLAHREGIRRTWLSLPHSFDGLIATKFFIGVDLGQPSDREKHEMTVREALMFGDIGILNLHDHYLSTPKKVVALFRWGVEECGAYWVLRSNDDVYLRIPPTLQLLMQHPPANVMMGLMIDGSRMSVPRPEHFDSTQADLYVNHKVWAFSRSDYPSDTFPIFPQGNAVILSRDLAAEVASIARKPWFRLMADDVMIALVVARFDPIKIPVRADYEFEGKYTGCHDDALWHFNIHPEHMYDLFHNGQLNYRQCDGILRFCCG